MSIREQDEGDPLNKFIAVNRDKFTLKLYKRPEDSWEFFVLDQYDVAVGAKGYSTPTGMYLINSRVKYPDWQVPDAEWATNAGLTPGDIIEGGTEANPLKERWLGVTDPRPDPDDPTKRWGVGIHGTGSMESIGTRASHGCIRMRPADVIDLYEKVPKYTPIYIHGGYISAEKFAQLLKEEK